MLALAALVEEYSEMLFRYAYRLSGSATDAEDLTQQTFLAAHRHLDQLREPGRAKPWLYAILRNVYLKQLRSDGGLQLDSLQDVAEPAAEVALDHPVDEEQLQAALRELPEEYRSPVVLFYFGELSYKEIAEQLEVPIGTVMSRLARAKSLLKKRLSPCPTK
ncbi:MAG: sigma-70 family RNA polymerase sigma factor [Planctomycetota bacterium]